ncbi:MAG: TonB-dependent receptor plug domain-containing protein [Luteitalea sp.]|nr:TonB-dependent receptor plug domain-containing protein [Luteitalea sp.]
MAFLRPAWLLFLGCVVLLPASGLHAQTLTASLSGTVSDATGGVLPGVTVTITNVATNVVAWQGVTDDTGTYRAPVVPVGQYDVTLELEGFKTVAIEGVRLQVDQRARVDAALEPSDLEETITVTGESFGRLESETSSQGLVINTSQVQNLPLPSRNALNLLTLAGGVSSGGAATGINPNQMSVNGSRTLNSEFTVDGVSVVSGSTGGLTRMPSTEALREFKVLTASYSAEYGRTSGASVNAVVDSGTNALRGSVYEYFRNEKLNANNFFNNLRGDPKPEDRYNQFGFTLGGPVTLPGLFSGRDRTFFFANYEGLRRSQPSTQISTIPDVAFRSGDFSASPVTVIDPQTGQPFPGNRIPPDRIDPAAAKMMALLPEPNASGTPDATTGRRVSNYVFNESRVPSNDEVTARIDHNAGRQARFFGRFTYYRLDSPAAQIIPGPLDPAVGDSFTKGYQTALGWTHTWSPALLTEVSFGYLRDDPRIDPRSQGIDVQETLGIERSAFPGTPHLNISDFSDLGMDSNTLRRQINNNYQASMALTWVRGSHALKIGTQFRFNQFNVFNPGARFAGIYDFNGEITSPTSSSGNAVNAMADFLLGAVKTADYELPQPMTGRRNYNLGLYVQDDWKVTPKLTLNMGLRYEYESPMWVDNDIYSRLDPETGQLLVANQNASRTLDIDGDTLNLAPRIGLAYSLNDRTVLRSAFGIFYSQIFSNLGGIVLYPGFTVRENFSNLGTGIAQPFTLSQGHPLSAQQDLNDPFFVERNATPDNPLSGGAQFGEASPLPYSQQWNVGVQREVGYGTIVDVSYVGSRGRHLPLSLQFNQIPFDRAIEVVEADSNLATQLARPSPNVAGFGSFMHVGNSIYHSLQLRASRQLTSRVGFQATYTWSKSIDDGSGLFNFSQPNGIDRGQFFDLFPEINRSLSSFDRPHVFAVAVQHTTGGPPAVRDIQVNVIVTARSGLPDTINQNNLHPLARHQRPDVVGDNLGGFAPDQTAEGTAIRYLLPTDDPNFPFRPVGPLFSGSGDDRELVLPFEAPGNLGRNTTREPGELNVDLALARRFPLPGGLGLTVRGEAFNLLNRVNLNGPNTSLNVIVDPSTGEAVFSSPNFGLIQSAKAARFIQLVARIDF